MCIEHINVSLLFRICAYSTHIKSKDLIKGLKNADWTVKRIKGSHQHLGHSDYNHVETVPHPKKDLSKALVRAIRKQANII